MNIQLLQGNFIAAEATELLSQLIQVKIKFHENKINGTHNEEDIKMRERRIKKLQHDLQEMRQHIGKKTGMISMESKINVLE